MKKHPTLPFRWLAVLGALQCALCLCQAQTKVLVNAFDTSDEVTVNNGQPWQNWFGTAFYQVVWDPSDASNNVNSGSIQIQAYFPDSGIGGCCGPQFLAMDGYSGINPPLVGNGGPPSSALATNVEFDVRFDPTSVVNGANWPTIEVGTRGGGYNQYDFGNFTLPASNTSWTHVVIPIGPSANWATIPNVYFKAYSTSLSGWLKFNVDNIQFTTAPVPIVPPTVAVAKASKALRLFSGPAQYNRSQLVAADTNQSWVGGSYPVTYSFNISAYDVNPPINEFHVFWAPLNYDQGGVINAFTDYSTSSNLLRLQIVGGAAGTRTVTANLDWKTNAIGANPDHIAASLTNATAFGTWTVRFDSATSGAVTPPGGTPASFSLPSDVAATFANPLAFFIGVQPNPTTAIGQLVDLTQIQTHGVASPGLNLSADFTTGALLDTNVWSLAATVDSTWMRQVTDATSWWGSWSYPDFGTVLATRPSLNGAVPWKTPAYYTGNDTNFVSKTYGSRNWLLMPAAALPTVDGTSNGVKSASAFFRAQNPAPAQ